MLDTHALLWWLDGSLGDAARKVIEDHPEERFVSSATIWEVEIKRATGKLSAPPDLGRRALENGFDPLDITFEHARRAGRLPAHHADPFDRMLVAQALVAGGMPIVTADRQIGVYGVPTVPAR